MEGAPGEAAADVTFACRRVPDALLTQAIRSAISPSRHAIAAAEDQLVTLLPLPWITVTLADATCVTLVGEGYIQLALYDLLHVDDAALGAPWASLRIHPGALTRLIRTAVLRGLPLQRSRSIPDFVAAVRTALGSSGVWPVVMPAECEFGLPSDFSQGPYQHCSYLEWCDLITCGDLLGASGRCAQGWGLLLFTMEPCWDLDDRWGHDSALISTAGQWQARTQESQYVSGGMGVRPGMFARSAVDVLGASREWFSVFLPRDLSVDREAEFTQLIALPSLEPKVQAVAFGQKVKDIIALVPGAGSLRLLMGRTEAKHQLYSWYRSLVAKFLPKASKFELATVLELSKQLTPRLSFLELERCKQMSDEERFEHVLTMKEEAELVSIRAGGVGEVKAAFVPSRLEQLHLSPRFEEAVLNIRAVLTAVPAPDSQRVLEAVLCQAVPFLSQHILGKRNLEGHPIYRELGQFRCLWGTKGDVNKRLGLLMGQALLKAHAEQAAPTLATGISSLRFSGDFSVSVGVVTHFLEGTLDGLNLENELLLKVQAELNGPCADPTPLVPDRDRFMLTDYVDRMIDEVSPVFELFGLGGMTDEGSFASVAQECKTTLRAIDGLGGDDRHELKYGGQFGLQPFMLSAMQCGGLTLQQLFRTDDPLVEVKRSCFLQFGPMAFKSRLSGLHEAVAARQHDQRVFGNRSRGSGDQNAAMERRIQALEAQLVQAAGKAKDSASGIGSDGAQAEASPSKSKRKLLADKQRESDKRLKAVDASSWVGHFKAAGVWYEQRKLVDVLVARFRYDRSEASRMCFAFGLDARVNGDSRQLSCPCPKAAGHTRSGDRYHSFPRGFSFEIPKIYQDFR
jgi:hypothetical protein